GAEAVPGGQRLRALHLGQGRAPRLQAPAVLRARVHGAVPGAVVVDFEARAADLDADVADFGQQAGERVLLAEARRVVERRVGAERGAHAVAVVDGGGHHGAVGHRDVPFPRERRGDRHAATVEIPGAGTGRISWVHGPHGGGAGVVAL